MLVADVFSFEREVRILENLPQVINSIDEFKAIAKVEDPILTAEWKLVAGYINNQFILTADSYGLSRYEKNLGLLVYPDDDLETRRFRILAKYQEKAPYTWKVLYQILDNLLGEGNYTLERDVDEKILTVRLELTIKNQYDVLVELLESITPQNMIIDVGLRYNTHMYLRQFRHIQLRNYTHRQLREDKLNPPPFNPGGIMSFFTHDELMTLSNDELGTYEYGD